MLTLKKHLSLTGLCMFLFSIAIQAQMKIGNNATNINGGSVLELESTNKGFLPPRVILTSTATWSLGGTAVRGMIVYDSAALSTGNTAYPVNPDNGGRGLYIWDSLSGAGGWRYLSTGNSGWALSGNAGTTPSSAAIGSTANSNFIGTTDSKDFVVATNNLERMRVASGGNVGIGTSSPTNALHINAATNPLRLQGLQNGAGTDSVLSIDANGLVYQQTLPGIATVTQSTSYSIPVGASTSSNINLSSTAGTFVIIPKTSFTFTLATAKSIFLNAMIGIDEDGFAGGLPYVNFQIYIDNAASGILMIQQESGGGAQFQVNLSGIKDLAAGSHTMDVRAAGWTGNGALSFSSINLAVLSVVNTATYLK